MGYQMDCLLRCRRRMTRAEAVGTSSVMTALAQPNQSPVPVGELSIVQSWTWVNDAAPAKAATTSRIRTRTTPSKRSPPVGRLVVVTAPHFRTGRTAGLPPGPDREGGLSPAAERSHGTPGRPGGRTDRR